MLTAITRGKAGRVRLPESDQDVSWRDVFRAREDLLTAVFFSRLRYLSHAALQRVIATLIGGVFAESLGEWGGIDFWPRLEGVNDRSWVEPDVLLRFERALVMVEVKPPFGGDQSAKQWRAQLDALRAELCSAAGIDELVVHYVALGRTSRVPLDALHDFDADEAFDLRVHRVEWDALSDALPGWIADAGRTDAAVFSDWAEAFALFGVRAAPRPRWEPLLVWVAANPVTPVSSPRQLVPTPLSARPRPVFRGQDWKPLVDFAQSYPLETTRWK